MAIGGSLRAALKAGNWARTAMESRRRARALADLNARGGIGNFGGRSGPEGAIDFLNRSGVDPSAAARYSPQMDGSRAFPAPGGGSTYLRPDGSRFRQQLQTGDPSGIRAPYEGFRVWNPGNDYFNAPPPFVGRGRPPFPDMPLLEQYGYPGLAPSFNDPYSMNVPLAFRGLANYNFPF